MADIYIDTEGLRRKKPPRPFIASLFRESKLIFSSVVIADCSAKLLVAHHNHVPRTKKLFAQPLSFVLLIKVACILQKINFQQIIFLSVFYEGCDILFSIKTYQNLQRTHYFYLRRRNYLLGSYHVVSARIGHRPYLTPLIL